MIYINKRLLNINKLEIFKNMKNMKKEKSLKEKVPLKKKYSIIQIVLNKMIIQIYLNYFLIVSSSMSSGQHIQNTILREKCLVSVTAMTLNHNIYIIVTLCAYYYFY